MYNEQIIIALDLQNQRTYQSQAVYSLEPLFRAKYQAGTVIACTDHGPSTMSQRSTIDGLLMPFVLSYESACTCVPRPKGMIYR